MFGTKQSCAAKPDVPADPTMVCKPADQGGRKFKEEVLRNVCVKFKLQVEQSSKFPMNQTVLNLSFAIINFKSEVTSCVQSTVSRAHLVSKGCSITARRAWPIDHLLDVILCSLADVLIVHSKCIVSLAQLGSRRTVVPTVGARAP